jgi:hypothetical protein
MLAGVLASPFVAIPFATPAQAAPVGTFAFLQTADRGFSFHLYVAASPGGKPKQVTPARAVGRPAFSPDGRHLVFSGPVGDDSDGRYGLYTVAANGSGLRRISAPSYSDFDPAWSADGQWLAFSRDYTGSSDPRTCCRLMIARSNGQNLRPLPGILGATHPAWSPDGARLAFTTPRGLWIVQRNGASPRLIVGGRISQPAWSPDGRFIAYAQRTSEDQTQLRVIAASGGHPAVRHAANGHVDSPAWDPDGRTLYFISHRGVGDESRSSSAIHQVAPGRRSRLLFRYRQQVFSLAFTPKVLGAGTTTPGLARPIGDVYHRILANTPDASDLAFNHAFGPVGSTPIAGDWNGDGTSTSGYVTVNASRTRLDWYLSNDNRTVAAHFEYGVASDRPVVGDWNGDGRWTVGIARSIGGRLNWLLTDDNRTVKPSVVFGFAGDQVVIGDWNGDGSTTLGTVRPVGANLAWYLTDNNVTISRRFTFGIAGATPADTDAAIAGDWNGDGRWTAGLVRQQSDALHWLLSDDSVAATTADDFLAGVPGDVPLVGNWDGL